MVCINNISVLHHLRDITTCTLYSVFSAESAMALLVMAIVVIPVGVTLD